MKIGIANDHRGFKTKQILTEYLTLKGYEALEKVADGQSTKLIIPSELSSLTSVVSAAVETVNATKANKPK